MKTTLKNQIRTVAIAIGLIGSLSSIAYGDPIQPISGQTCQTIGTTTAGGCSGKPTGTPPNVTCPGGKTNTEHAGCTQCVSGSETDTCTQLTPSGICQKRTQTIPCVIVDGSCIEGQAGAWSGWGDTPEQAC
jgi:hypothetical protein